MKKHLSIQSTIYPFGYDKNGATDRNKKRFCKGFNAWSAFIHESCIAQESEGSMNNTLNDAKKLIGI